MGGRKKLEKYQLSEYQDVVKKECNMVNFSLGGKRTVTKVCNKSIYRSILFVFSRVWNIWTKFKYALLRDGIYRRWVLKKFGW